MFNPDRVTYFGATDSRGKRVPFGLKAKDRQRHMYVIGKTGMGKSKLLENMAIQDIQNGEGLAFIDPHGSAIESLLDYIPQHRINDVVYFAPFDLDNPIAFNVMEDVGYDKRHLVVSGLMATFKNLWVDAWSARMEYILTNTLLALLEYPDATLLGVNRMYVDKAYRKLVVDNIKDPVVKDFWTKEWAAMSDTFIRDATPAIQNKIGQFTGNPLIRNIIGQPKSSFDIRKLMDGNKILLINLSKGLVGDTNMRLLGSMLVTRIFLAAMSRAELAPSELKKAEQFYLYVDEFQNFANDTFSEILSEARKYSLNLIIAHQYVEQMEEQVRAAVFGNVGTTIAFRVGPFDAETLETVFQPNFNKEDLVNLGLAQIYLTLMIDGVGSPPFSAVTLPPIEAPRVSFRERVIESSRRQFATNRAKVEESIFAELATTQGMGDPEPPKKSGSRGGQGGQGQGMRVPNDQRAPARSDERNAPRAPQQARTELSTTRQDQPYREAPQADRSSNRPRSDQARTERERTERPRPEPQQNAKTAEDLKAILRTMTGKESGKQSGREPSIAGAAKGGSTGLGGAQKSGTVAAQAQPAPLKSALADVLARADMQPSAIVVPEPAPKPQPVPAPQPQPRPQPSPQPQQPERTATPTPYEVPESTLRSIFNEKL
jgi:hypothetical protein